MEVDTLKRELRGVGAIGFLMEGVLAMVRVERVAMVVMGVVAGSGAILVAATVGPGPATRVGDAASRRARACAGFCGDDVLRPELLELPWTAGEFLRADVGE